MKQKSVITARKRQTFQAPAAVDLSPLDHIRQTEADMFRAIAAGREAAQELIADAHRQAAELKRQARQAGLQEGQAHYKTLLAQAEDEAKVILAEAHDQADELRQRAHRRMEEGTRQALDAILGLAREVEQA